MALAKFAPADCILTTDSGNAPTWMHRHWPFTPKNNLIGGIVGAMGLGVPAAIAASLVQPKRMAICFVGDGGVLMNDDTRAPFTYKDTCIELNPHVGGNPATAREAQQAVSALLQALLKLG